MRIVLDTNVFVSALLKPASAPARLVEHLLSEEVITVLVDRRILEEYREVLSRKKFGFEPTLLKDFLDALEAVAIFVEDPPVIVDTATPADDRPFLEVAIAGDADALVTGNKKHFPDTGDIEVMSPGDLVRLLED